MMSTLASRSSWSNRRVHLDLGTQGIQSREYFAAGGKSGNREEVTSELDFEGKMLNRGKNEAKACEKQHGGSEYAWLGEDGSGGRVEACGEPGARSLSFIQ